MIKVTKIYNAQHTNPLNTTKKGNRRGKHFKITLTGRYIIGLIKKILITNLNIFANKEPNLFTNYTQTYETLGPNYSNAGKINYLPIIVNNAFAETIRAIIEQSFLY